MGDKKQKIIPAHYSWNSSIFTRGVIDPIKRKLGWVDENEHPVSLKESATGQEWDRMKDTAKNAGKLVVTGLAFGNPVTASATMAPLITGSQAYFMTEGLKDAYDRVTSPNKTAADGAMVALDVVGAAPAFNAIRNGAKYVLLTAAKTVAPVLIAKQISKTKLPTVEPTLNIGWGPKQTLKVFRAGEYDQMYFPERWDVVNEGANPHGVWLQGKYGIPRTDLTNPGKGAKAARARNVFSTRPDKYTGTVTFDKPMITVGEVPNRSSLSYQADNMGSDGLIYNGVYDNGYNNNQVILSFKKPNLKKIKLSEEERLGIPKVERNNIDNAVGRARTGNDRRRLKFLREMHFKEASPNNTIIDDKGHFIKLSKRDNFNNPDIRYKQGGILKRVESGKSGIHIKPENRGKFTALKKRTGKSSTWYKEHGTPAQKKMAIFALNARKWKHK